MARSKPIYKNLDILRDSLKRDEVQKKFADTRESNYMSKNKSLKGLQDFVGQFADLGDYSITGKGKSHLAKQKEQLRQLQTGLDFVFSGAMTPA